MYLSSGQNKLLSGFFCSCNVPPDDLQPVDIHGAMLRGFNGDVN